MKIFIIYCLLFIHVNMCIYIMHMFIESPYFSYYFVIQSGFWVSIRVLGIRGFGFGDGLSPESVFGAVSGFDFGFWVWVHRDSTRSKSAPLPSLLPSAAVSWPSPAALQPPKAPLERPRPPVPLRAQAPPWAAPDRPATRSHWHRSHPKRARHQPTAAASIGG